MRTCGDCDFKLNTGCVHRNLLDFVGSTFPACNHWTLSDDAIKRLVGDGLSRSRKGAFVQCPNEADAYRYEMAAIYYNHLRESMEGKLDPLVYALLSKVFAFVGNVSRGNFDESMSNAGDIAAILVRSLNREWEKEETK